MCAPPGRLLTAIALARVGALCHIARPAPPGPLRGASIHLIHEGAPRISAPRRSLHGEGSSPTKRTLQNMPTDAIQCKPLEVAVGDKGIERAIKHLKRKMAAEGILRELKRRRHYMKPSVKRRKKASEAARRRRKRSKMDMVA